MSQKKALPFMLPPNANILHIMMLKEYYVNNESGVA